MAAKEISQINTPVLIVGGGITGLSAALFLLHQGIAPLLVERKPSVSIQPKARGFDIRTMELLREINLSEQIREAGKALSPSRGILTNQSLAKALEKRKPKKEKFPYPSPMKGLESIAALSPETPARCTQDLSEPILLHAARQRGANIQLNTELLSFSQGEESITAIISNRETGVQTKVIADYIIAADGAKSFIRETLKAKTQGKGALGNLLNIYFEADLKPYVKNKEFSILRIDEPQIKGFLSSINNSDRWTFQLFYNPDFGERPEDYNESRLQSILQKVIGIPGVNIRIISVLPWQPTVKVVEKMQHGRIFLAGDAAHVMTPYGGKGANTGIQDVHNLAWKLALVLKEKAHPDLLPTYNAERRPIGWRYAEASRQTADEFGLLKKPTIQFVLPILKVKLINKLSLQQLFPKASLRHLGYLLGLPHYQYSSVAIITDDPSSNGVADRLQGAPGTRIPHLWVNIQNETKSTLDLLGKGFVLVTGSKNDIWAKVTEIIDEKYAIHIPFYNMGKSGIIASTGIKIYRALGIEESGALLVRPDGFVAWKIRNGESNDYKSLTKAIIQILGIDKIRKSDFNPIQ
jgi:2-polyprenyl-6-methoxyphenol hydroxylase-like FAD-dependent oxidoreductase